MRTILEELAGRAQEYVAKEGSESEALAADSAWNLSQTLQHCAQTIRYSVTGYPRLKPTLFRATVGVLAKRVFLSRGRMRHPLDAVIDGAPPLDPNLSLSAAVGHLTDAVTRFTTHTGALREHPTYGHCTHEQFTRLHAMHLVEHLPGLARG
ncbi:DUF1569 domain-containing protein [Streptomyces sp. NPDC047043]|uniref:DUF1569 domain-containing protein n=1 Tax=Streptomyces sp. NPDC047043 TaxID=3154497 RepID=UPI0033C24FE8